MLYIMYRLDRLPVLIWQQISLRAQSARVHLAFSGWMPVVLGGASTTIFRRTQTCDLRPQTPKPFRTLFSKSRTSLCFFFETQRQNVKHEETIIYTLHTRSQGERGGNSTAKSSTMS